MNHLAELAENPAALPVACTTWRGGSAWEGLGLLSGSSITGIVTASALTLFCPQYGQDNGAALLRQESPGLTDEDITWLCGLAEEMEPFEP